jgi:hypothetical protein
MKTAISFGQITKPFSDFMTPISIDSMTNEIISIENLKSQISDTTNVVVTTSDFQIFNVQEKIAKITTENDVIIINCNNEKIQVKFDTLLEVSTEFDGAFYSFIYTTDGTDKLILTYNTEIRKLVTIILYEEFGTSTMFFYSFDINALKEQY